MYGFGITEASGPAEFTCLAGAVVLLASLLTNCNKYLANCNGWQLGVDCCRCTDAESQTACCADFQLTQYCHGKQIYKAIAYSSALLGCLLS